MKLNGGLIEAYREAGREAVTDAGLSTNILKLPLTFGYTPDLTRHVMSHPTTDADITGERYTDRRRSTSPWRRADDLTSTLLNIHGVDLSIQHLLHPIDHEDPFPALGVHRRVCPLAQPGLRPTRIRA